MNHHGAEDGPRLWAVVGATGTGKTALSLDLAESLAASGRPAEIVNADAMQLYRGMDIGTAKLPEDERRGIPHHLFDVLDVTDDAAVAWYQDAARAAIGDIHSRGADAVLVGGSGLYISSVLFDFRFPPRDENLRARLEVELEQAQEVLGQGHDEDVLHGSREEEVQAHRGLPGPQRLALQAPHRAPRPPVGRHLAPRREPRAG